MDILHPPAEHRLFSQPVHWFETLTSSTATSLLRLNGAIPVYQKNINMPVAVKYMHMYNITIMYIGDTQKQLSVTLKFPVHTCTCTYICTTVTVLHNTARKLTAGASPPWCTQAGGVLNQQHPRPSREISLPWSDTIMTLTQSAMPLSFNPRKISSTVLSMTPRAASTWAVREMSQSRSTGRKN